MEAGHEVGGKYRIVRRIGGGASATVYEAEHLLIGSHVAIKVVHSDLSRRDEMLERFQQEARICGTIRSPYLPQVYDVGHLPDGSPYMVMELLDGETLEAKLARGPIPLPTVVEIGRQLMAALVDIHRADVIHRDVKPENIILHSAGGVTILKLVDFGVCKPTKTDRAITMEGMVVGTPHYMAPEQIRGDDLDARADVYAAGVVLYEAITGKPPFSGAGLGDIAAAILRDPVVPPSIKRPDCPRELEEIVMKAMSRDRDARFPTPKDMARDLSAVVRKHAYPTGIAAWALSPPRGFIARTPGRVSDELGSTARVGVPNAREAQRPSVGQSTPPPAPAPVIADEVSTRRGPRLFRETDPIRVPTRRRWPVVAGGTLAIAAAAGAFLASIGGLPSSTREAHAIFAQSDPPRGIAKQAPTTATAVQRPDPPLPEPLPEPRIALAPAVAPPAPAAPMLPAPVVAPPASAPRANAVSPAAAARVRATAARARAAEDRARAEAAGRASNRRGTAARAPEGPTTTTMIDPVGQAREDIERLRRMGDLPPEPPPAPVAPIDIDEEPGTPEPAPPPSAPGPPPSESSPVPDNPYDDPPPAAPSPPAEPPSNPY